MKHEIKQQWKQKTQHEVKVCSNTHDSVSYLEIFVSAKNEGIIYLIKHSIWETHNLKKNPYSPGLLLILEQAWSTCE